METRDSEYCRDIEAYLCRKNDGHLIRIVGPAFERVCEWADKGVPLKVAFRGIDRYFERYYARGPRRRPVRVEHCEADVLDLFDEWRRAVGVAAVRETRGAYSPDPASGGDPGRAEEGQEEDGPEPHSRRRGSLSAHLDRTIARLTALRSADDRMLDAAIEDAVRQLDALRAAARSRSPDARQSALEGLRALDKGLVAAARSVLAPSALEQIVAEADAELAPFRGRMPPETYAGARDACADRIIRDRAKLPTLTFEQ